MQANPGNHGRPVSREELVILALGLIPGLGSFSLRLLAEYLRIENIGFEELVRNRPDVMRRAGIHPDVSRALRGMEKALRRAEQITRLCERRALGWIGPFDPDYPNLLTRFHGASAPWFLFYHGDRSILNSNRSLGIVGTREPVEKSALLAELLAGEAAGAGMTVISGGARGIDLAAHRGALQGGCTIIVPASGMTLMRPPADLKRVMAHPRTLTISEFPPDEPGTKSTPIQRNRMVAALSDALFVVETGLRGGTLHTVRFAREFGKPILVLDHAPETNPPGNASLLATVAHRVPACAPDHATALFIKASAQGRNLASHLPPGHPSLF